MIGVQTPVLLTITKTNYELRFPTIKSKLAATRTQVPVLTAKDLNLDPEKCGLKGSGTKMIQSGIPEKKTSCLKIQEETNAQSAHKLFELLHSKHII